MNYLFLSSLGKSPLEGQALGAASAAADVLKAMLPFFIAWSWQAQRFVAAAAGTLVFAFFAGFSLLSAIGFAADNRGVLVHERDNRSAAYERVHGIREYADARRKALPTHRASAIVTQEIEHHRQNRRWDSTRSCTNATVSESRNYCAAYFTLRLELAAAQEAERLANEIEKLDARLARLRAEGAGQDSDPQVSLLTRITGQEEEFVRLALIIVVALLVEIGASLGLFLASGHGASKKEAAAAKTPIASVEDFALEALKASSGALSAEALAATYDTWCREHGYRPLPSAAFNAAFYDLAREVGIECRGGSFRRIGVSALAFKQAA